LSSSHNLQQALKKKMSPNSDSQKSNPKRKEARDSRAKKITVLLVDDHTVVRRGFRRLLDDSIGLKVVGEAGDGDEAIRIAQKLKPGVVVMDCAMPGTNGLVATEEIIKTCPDTAVLILSMHSEYTWVRKAMQIGARGFILKNANELDLGAAIKRVAAGELVFDPQLPAAPANRRGRRDLTSRELEILHLIVEGRSNKEIGDRLGISSNTVDVHRSRIMNAAGVRKTADLVVYAIRRGLVYIR
jgi:DNA-binding NarL/FixJ family response regulator